MKYLLLSLLLFSVGCNENENETEKKLEEQNQLLQQILEQIQTAPEKLQKNSTFTPKCSSGSFDTRSYYGAPNCSIDTKPACGTISGSGEMNVYCIDSNDIITSAKPTCITGRSYCFQKTLE